MFSVFKFGTNGNDLLTPVRSAQNNRLMKGRQDEFLYLLFNTVQVTYCPVGSLFQIAQFLSFNKNIDIYFFKNYPDRTTRGLLCRVSSNIYIGPQLPPCVRCPSVAGPLNLQKIASFYFYIFQKYFLQKYIFNFTIYSFIPIPPDRVAAGGGRDLYVNKNNFYLRGGSWREPAASLPGGRLSPQI